MRTTNTLSAYVDAQLQRNGACETEREFSARVSDCRHRVFQIALGVLADPADAEEVAQETFLLAFRRHRSLRDPARFSAWVCRIALRQALNRRRARGRRLGRETAWHDLRQDPVGGLPEQRLLLRRLREEIDRLPRKLRTVLLLCAVEGMEHSEVATILRIPAGTVRSRLFLARRRLLEVMR